MPRPARTVLSLAAVLAAFGVLPARSGKDSPAADANGALIDFSMGEGALNKKPEKPDGSGFLPGEWDKPPDKPDLEPEPDPGAAPLPYPDESDRARAGQSAQRAEDRLNQSPNPDPARTTRVAREYLRAGDPDGAIRVLDRLIDSDGADAEALRLRSGAKILKEEWRGAYSDAREALGMNPGDKLAADLAGTAKMQLERLGLKPSEAKPPKLRAPERAELPSRPAAQPAPEGDRIGSGPVPLLSGRENGNDPRLALFAAIDRKLAIGGGREALLDLSRYLDRNPDDATALGKRAYILNRGKNPKAALSDADRALALTPDDPAALREKAYALIQLGQAQGALALLERAIALQPKNGLGYLYRAMARNALGEHDAAMSDYAKAAELDPALQGYYDEALAAAGGGHKKAPGASANWRVRALFGTVALSLVLVGLWNALRARSGRTTRGAEPLEAAPPPAETLVDGNVLGGLYRVGRVLGRGGMGVVFEAWDLGLERKVAIKQLRTPQGAQEDYDRFLKEARLVARLQHPNIVQIHTLVEDNSLLYLVFELVEGRGLDAVLAEKGRFSPQEAWAAVRDVCAALDCAHEARIIHRDLKPSNIMVTSKGVYKVMDFGIAHQAQSELMLTQTGAWGTPPYMAPEQERGLVSRESDLYALGCTVYELMTGGRPFGPGADKTTQSFKPLSSLVHGLPPAMDAFMKQALAPEPAFRFHSGREFLAAFEGALSGRVAA